MHSKRRRKGKALIEITIPVLNEELTLRRNVTRLRRYLDQELSQLGPIAIVVADNGSTDRTVAEAETAAAELGQLRVLSVGQRGVGRALKASWATSTADIIGYMDLDFATDLAHVGPALSLLLDVDGPAIVNGSRLKRGSRVVGRSLQREVTSRTFNAIVKRYFHTTFTDGMCGFKFLRRSVLAELLQRGVGSDGWFFSTELLVVAQHEGLLVHELPVRWTDDGDSRVRIGALSLEYLRDMRQLKRRMGC